MVTDLLPNEQRQAGFSLKYLSINVGVSVGPIIAGFLFNNLLPMLFIGDAFTTFMAVLLIWKYVGETHIPGSKVKVESKAERAEKGNIFEMFIKRPHLVLFFLLNMVYSFIYTQHRFSLPITLNQQFDHQGAELFGYLMSINAITVLVLTVFISALTRKNHQLTNMVFSGVLYALGFGMIGYSNHFYLFVLSTIIWTGGEILSIISTGVYVANNSPSNYRARLYAIMTIGFSVGASISTAVSGAYIQYFGCRSVWTLTFYMSFIAAALMLALKSFSKKMESRKYAD
jgi:MFS family permease